MRHLTFLLIVTITLVGPANLFAQTEQAAPAKQPAQSKEATHVTTPTNSAATNQPPRADDFYRFVSNQRWGAHLQVRMKSKALFHGTRAEVNPGYFVLLHRGKSIFIAYKDIASIKTGRTFWEQAGRVAMWPLKGALNVTIISVYYCAYGVAALIYKITGKDMVGDR